MYKVFVNERPIILSPKPLILQGVKSIAFESREQLAAIYHEVKKLPHIAEGINVFSSDVEVLKNTLFSLLNIVEAAGGIVQNTQGRYLFIKRMGYWDLPKGKIDRGETIEHAAIREVEEECGINGLRITATAGHTYHTYELKGWDTLKLTHWFLMQSSFSGTLVPQTEEAITEARWMDKEEILSTVMPKTYSSIAELVEREILDK